MNIYSKLTWQCSVPYCGENYSYYNSYSTTVLKIIKEMPQSLLYDIPCYFVLGYEKWYTSILLALCGEIRAFEVQDHVNYIYTSRFRCGVDLVHFVLAFQKWFLVEKLLFQINLPLFKHFVDKNRYATKNIADNLIYI